MISDQVMGIDIGGSFIKVAVVDCRTGSLLTDQKSIATPQSSPTEFLTSIKHILDFFGWRGAIGIGFPGVVKKGVVRTAVHLHPEWVGRDLKQEVSAHLGVSADVLNDADAAGLAEMRFGAGKNLDISIHGVTLVITLGTGIGSALFVDGELIPNTELGHIYLDDGREAEEIAAASLRMKLNLSWEEFGNSVDRYLRYVQRIISADHIIIGGGVSENWDLFAPFVSTRDIARPAKLGNRAGLIGAAMQARASSTQD